MAKQYQRKTNQFGDIFSRYGYPGFPNVYIMVALYFTSDFIFGYDFITRFSQNPLVPFLALLAVSALLGACMSYCARTIPRAFRGRTYGLAADVWWYSVQFVVSTVLLAYALVVMTGLGENSTAYLAMGIAVVVAMFLLVNKGKPEGAPEDLPR